MKTALTFASALLIFLASIVLSAKNPAPTQVVEQRNHSGFVSIENNSNANIVIIPSNQYKVVIIGTKESVTELTTQIKADELKIARVHQGNYYDKNDKLTIEISMPVIKSIKQYGSGNFSMDGKFETEELMLSNSGSGNVSLHLTTNLMMGKLSGSGNLNMKGSINKLDLELSGSGNSNISEVSINKADIKLIGSGNCKISQIPDLDVKITGSGKINYQREVKD